MLYLTLLNYTDRAQGRSKGCEGEDNEKRSSVNGGLELVKKRNKRVEIDRK